MVIFGEQNRWVIYAVQDVKDTLEDIENEKTININALHNSIS